MVTVGLPTFDQLRIFLAVVDTGSFSSAGRQLNRVTSVVSYAISNLEAQLGLALFEREATRRPKLTVAGNALLAEARAVLHGIDGLRAKARGLLEGVEAEVHLAVDVLMPTARVADVLRDFRGVFPTVALRLSVEALGAVASLVLEQKAIIGISGPVASQHDMLERIAIGTVPLVPVAAPSHPLAQTDRIMPGAARDHIQLVLTDRSPLTDGKDFSVSSPRTWRLADLGSKHVLLREGIGWGNMPRPMVADDLEAGRLVELDIPDHRGGLYRFDGIYRTDSSLGPAAAWLLQRFARCAEKRVDQLDLGTLEWRAQAASDVSNQSLARARLASPPKAHKAASAAASERPSSVIAYQRRNPTGTGSRHVETRPAP